MWDTAVVIAKWIALLLAISPIVLGIGWGIVEGSILPRLISRAEIHVLANTLMQRRPDDPEEAAFIEEYAAWYRSESYEQGKWRRVRKEIRRRLRLRHHP